MKIDHFPRQSEAVGNVFGNCANPEAFGRVVTGGGVMDGMEASGMIGGEVHFAGYESIETFGGGLTVFLGAATAGNDADPLHEFRAGVHMAERGIGAGDGKSCQQFRPADRFREGALPTDGKTMPLRERSEVLQAERLAELCVIAELRVCVEG